MDKWSHYEEDFSESLMMYNSTEGPEFEFNDYVQRVIVSTVFIAVSLLGIFGNSLVILAVILSRKLRTTTNAFVVNLSVADLLTALVIPWDAVALLGRDGLPVGEWVCSVVAVMQSTTVGCSMYTLASVGLNRLLLITRRATIYRIIDTPRKISMWLVITWLIPLLVTLLPPVLGVGAVGYNRKYHNCGSKSSHARSDDYDIIIATVLYPTPLVTILVCYTLIWRHLNRHAKRLTTLPEEPDELSGSNTSGATRAPLELPTISRGLSQAPTRQPTVSRSRMSRRQYEITRNMLYVVWAFMLCLTPFAVCLVYDDSDPVLPYAAAILVVNSCINPLIYATKHRDFKTVFDRILRRQWDHIPEPSDVLKTFRRTKCCVSRRNNPS